MVGCYLVPQNIRHFLPLLDNVARHDLQNGSAGLIIEAVLTSHDANSDDDDDDDAKNWQLDSPVEVHGHNSFSKSLADFGLLCLIDSTHEPYTEVIMKRFRLGEIAELPLCANPF